VVLLLPPLLVLTVVLLQYRMTGDWHGGNIMNHFEIARLFSPMYADFGAYGGSHSFPDLVRRITLLLLLLLLLVLPLLLLLLLLVLLLVLLVLLVLLLRRLLTRARAQDMLHPYGYKVRRLLVQQWWWWCCYWCCWCCCCCCCCCSATGGGGPAADRCGC